MVLWGYADYQAEEAKTPAVAPGRAGEGNAAVSLSCNTRSGDLQVSVGRTVVAHTARASEVLPPIASRFGPKRALPDC
jgi:hypothetical protein